MTNDEIRLAAKVRQRGEKKPECRSPNGSDLGSRRRQSALISEEKKLAPTDVGGYTLGPCSPRGTTSRSTSSFLEKILVAASLHWEIFG